MRDFIPPPDAIQLQAAIHIAAPPEHAAAVYCRVDKWPEIFPATIEQARVTATGGNWQQIEVSHKQEGRVPNTLIFLSATEIGLVENKPRFDASFLNQFTPAAGGGAHYVVTAYIHLKGIYRLLEPLLRGYVRRRARKQIQRYVLDPLKTAAENARL